MTMGTQRKMAEWLEQAWLTRYLDRELDADEVEWFESYLLDKPHLVEALEQDEQLRCVVATNSNSVMSGDDSADDRSPRTIDVRPGRAPIWLAWAASLLLVAGLTRSIMHLQPDAEVALASAPPRIVYDTLRGELSKPHEEAGDPSSPIRIYEVPLPYGSTIASVYADVDGARKTLPRPVISTEGYVTFALPAAWRNAGTLHVTIKREKQPDTDLAFGL